MISLTVEALHQAENQIMAHIIDTQGRQPFPSMPDLQVEILKYLVITSGDLVWRTGELTQLLFTIGKFFIGLYLGRSSVASSYGVAGSFVVLLVWVYYSSQILYLGAEITKVYTDLCGADVQPAANAERAA